METLQCTTKESDASGQETFIKTPIEANSDTPLISGDIPRSRLNEMPQPSILHHGVWKRLGIWTTVSLLFGMVLNVTSLGILWFLWLSKGGNRLSRSILVNSFLTRTITICSLVLRTATALETGVFISMMASVALERGIITLTDAPAVSTLRYVNDGPFKLFLLLSKRPRFSKVPSALLVSTILITSILLQFTSTVLISDISPGFMFTGVQRMNVSYDGPISTSNNEGLDTNVWTSRPVSYPLFAEWSEAPQLASDAVDDTGMTIRAMLPFATEQSRSLLHTYEGPATVFNSRVVCVLPMIEGSIGLYEAGLLVDGGPASETAVHLNVSATPSHWPPGVYNYSETARFVRNAVFPDDNSTTEWTITICWAEEIVGNAPIAFREGAVGSSPLYENLLWNSVLVVNTTVGTGGSWYDVLAGGDQQEIGSIWNVTSEANGWITLTRPPYNVSIGFTLCIFDYANYKINVTASTMTNNIEPSLAWDNQTHSFDSTGVRTQLGAMITPLSVEDRGILSLQPFGNETQETLIVPYLEDEDYIWSDVFYDHISSDALCNSAVFGGVNLVSRFLVDVFQDICRTTGRVSLALQAHFTTLMLMAYYDNIFEFTYTAPANVESFVPVDLPQSFMGLIAVTAVICVHSILVVLCTIQFVLSTRYSMLGNAWQTVTQVFTPETESIFTMGGILSDEQARKELNSEGMKHKSIVLRPLGNSDRVVLNIVGDKTKTC